MEIFASIFAMLFFICIAAVVKPFKPFNRRRNAAFSAIACFIIIGVIGSSVGDTKYTQSTDAREKTTKKRETISRERLETNLTEIKRLISEDRFLDAHELLIQTGYMVLDEDRAFFNEERDQIKTKIARVLLDATKLDAHDAAKSIQQLKSTYEEATLYASRETARTFFEPKVAEFVKGLPASQFQENEAGYRLLYRINPSNDSYLSSAEKYRDRQIQSALGVFRTSYDKISKTTFYTHKNAPAYVNSRSTVYLYIGRSSSSEWLRMKTIYTANSWLFVDKVIAYADGQTATLTSGRFDRDHNNEIWEWHDETPTASQLSTLRMLANADDATLRFVGSQYRKDVQLSRNDKRVILETLTAFERLKDL